MRAAVTAGEPRSIAMLSLAKLQVLRSVVVLHPVDVMHGFPWIKGTAERLFHDDSMFFLLPTIDRHEAVSLFGRVTIASPTAACGRFSHIAMVVPPHVVHDAPATAVGVSLASVDRTGEAITLRTERVAPSLPFVVVLSAPTAYIWADFRASLNGAIGRQRGAANVPNGTRIAVPAPVGVVRTAPPASHKGARATFDGAGLLHI